MMWENSDRRRMTVFKALSSSCLQLPGLLQVPTPHALHPTAILHGIWHSTATNFSAAMHYPLKWQEYRTWSDKASAQTVTLTLTKKQSLKKSLAPLNFSFLT